LNNTSSKSIVHRKWRYRESFAICVGLVIIGLIFSLLLKDGGPQPLYYPANIYIGLIFLAILIFIQFRFRHHYLVVWLSSIPAAISAFCFLGAWMAMMMVIPQGIPPRNIFEQALGLTSVKTSWPFLMLELNALTILGLVSVKRLFPINLQNMSFFITHFSLWMFMSFAIWGHGDIKRAKVNLLEQDKPSDMGLLPDGSFCKLPFKIQLIDFKIEEYPPRITLVSIKSEESVLPRNEKLPHLKAGQCISLGEWFCYTDTLVDNAIAVGNSIIRKDTIGSCTAAHIRVFDAKGHERKRGWISTGSFAQPPLTMPLSDYVKIAMPPRSPQIFDSRIVIQRDSLHSDTLLLNLNHPLNVDGWKIYQHYYDNYKGRWSNLSILEVVKDPWRCWLYGTLIAMVAGIILMLSVGKKREQIHYHQ
jgi:hypothetical protein